MNSFNATITTLEVRTLYYPKKERRLEFGWVTQPSSNNTTACFCISSQVLNLISHHTLPLSLLNSILQKYYLWPCDFILLLYRKHKH